MFSFEGRIGRSELWGAVITDIVFAAIVYGVYVWIGTHMGGLRATPTPVAVVILFVFSALTVPLSVATAASLIKRYHDRGKSGWWSLLAIIVIGLIEPLFFKGTNGKNAYGANPLPKAETSSAQTTKTATQASTLPKQATPQTTPPKSNVMSPIQTAMSAQPASSGESKMQNKPSAPIIPPAPKVHTSAPAPASPSQAPASVAPVTSAMPKPPTSTQPVPPARSMSEMLAELQRLSAEENSFAAKVPPRTQAPPTPAPVTATPTQSQTQPKAVPPKA